MSQNFKFTTPVNNGKQYLGELEISGEITEIDRVLFTDRNNTVANVTDLIYHKAPAYWEELQELVIDVTNKEPEADYTLEMQDHD